MAIYEYTLHPAHLSNIRLCRNHVFPEIHQRARTLLMLHLGITVALSSRWSWCALRATPTYDYI